MTTTTSQPSIGARDIEMAVRSASTQALGMRNAAPLYEDNEHGLEVERPLPQDSDDDDDDSNEGANDALLTKDTYSAPNSKQWPLWRKRSGSRTVPITICVVIFSIVVVAGLLFHTFSIRNRRRDAGIGPHWKDFGSIEHYFAFGDSWTTTHFDVNSEQPSTKNPIGNPAFPGQTSSAGANYVGYLTTQYNHSFIKTYDFAFSGSVIDAQIDRSLLDWLDFAHQLKDEFIKYYTTDDNGVARPTGWSSDNSLFSVFFGINDVVVFNRTNPRFDQLLQTYESLIDKLYDASARNFLILNIPPIDKSPAVTQSLTQISPDFVGDVTSINNLIAELAGSIRAKYKDVTVFEYDVHDLFERFFEDRQAIPQTIGYKDVYNFCPEYKKDEFEHGGIPTTEQIEACGGLNIDEYLWKDELHITWPMHDAIAAGIESVLIQDSMS